MRSIDNSSAQSLAGHTSEVANLPTTAIKMDDGMQFHAACGSTFLDVDTGDVYLLFDGAWYKIGKE